MALAVSTGKESLDRRNYLAHSADGALYFLGMSFVSGTTLLPQIAKELGAASWLIALAPTVNSIGMLLPSLLTAHWVERLRRYMPVMVPFGFAQRAPYFVAGLVLVLMGQRSPLLALVAVMAAPFVSGVLGGITSIAWQQLFITTIPPNRRSSVLGWRMGVSAVGGTGVGLIVAVVLARWPGVPGYGVLYLISFAALMVSYLAFVQIREAPLTEKEQAAALAAEAEAPASLLENLRAVPDLLLSRMDYTAFIFGRFLRSGVFILTPFMAIYALNVLARTPHQWQRDSYLGLLLTAQMVGAVLGNLVSGYLGDRLGSRALMLLSTGLFIWLAIWFSLAGSDWEFRILFALYGLAITCGDNGLQTLNWQVCPPVNRTTYLALANFVNLPGMLLAAICSTALWQVFHGHIAPLALTAAFSVTASAAFALGWVVKAKGRPVGEMNEQECL